MGFSFVIIIIPYLNSDINLYKRISKHESTKTDITNQLLLQIFCRWKCFASLNIHRDSWRIRDMTLSWAYIKGDLSLGVPPITSLYPLARLLWTKLASSFLTKKKYQRDRLNKYQISTMITEMKCLNYPL